MPTTLGGLLIFVVLLVPGLLHYVQRRSRVPQRSLSPLVETATLATVSVATNALAIGAFGLVRSLSPGHTPDVGRLVLEGAQYGAPRLGYLLLWSAGVMALSSALAVVLGIRPRWLRTASTRLAPVIVDVSAWYHVFEAAPEDALVYLGCDLQDGAYVGGTLEWYSTEVEETPNRDLSIAEPITYRPAGESDPQILPGVARVVLSAGDVARMYVSYIAADAPTTHSEAT